MATAMSGATRVRRVPHAPDRYERILAAASIVLLAAVLVAVARGHARWNEATPAIWAHMATIGVSLALTPVMLLRPRGDRPHRVLGWIWTAGMVLTAASSFAIHRSNPGGYSVIHLLSLYVLIAAPMAVRQARRHNVAGHRRWIRGLVTGALLIAGFFTFPFHRMLGGWLFG